MMQFHDSHQWNTTVTPRIQELDGGAGMRKQNRVPKEKVASKETEYIVSDFFTGKKTLKESLLALMIRDMKKL